MVKEEYSVLSEFLDPRNVLPSGSEDLENLTLIHRELEDYFTKLANEKTSEFISGSGFIIDGIHSITNVKE